MGYAIYEIPRPDQHCDQTMKRGYAITCKCHHRGCKSKIDRGLAYLCYSCTWYFCDKHMVITDKEFECFAGKGIQVCYRCYKAVKNKAE